MSRTTVRTPTIEFSRGPADFADGDVVRRRGVIFRAGDYAHQKFAMTPDELRAVAANFRAPVPLDHGHPTTDGPIEFGRLVAVEASPDGTTLYGQVEAASWLDQAMKGAKAWRVSASFDRATRAIRRLSLVTRPQISDAELQAAFACACGGDHTKAEEAPAMTKKEQALAKLAEMDDESVFDAILAPDDAHDADDGDVPEGFDDAPAAGTGDFADETAAEFAARDARIAELEAKDRRRDAEVFADAAIKDGLALPAERARLVARHAQFALIEQTTPADFASGRRLTLVADFEADVRARRAHRWGADLIPADFSGRVLDNGGDRPETDEEYARRVNLKHNGRFRKPGAAS